jgi:phasin family protein
MATAQTDFVKDTTEVMKEASMRIESLAADSQKAFTAQMEKLAKGFQQAASFGQDTIEAMIKSNEIAARALEGLNAEFVGYTKKSFEDGVAAAKDLAAAKTVSDLVEKQAGFARAAMDGMLKQAAKINEMMMSAARSAAEPVGARFTAAADVLRGFAA